MFIVMLKRKKKVGRPLGRNDNYIRYRRSPEEKEKFELYPSYLRKYIMSLLTKELPNLLQKRN